MSMLVTEGASSSESTRITLNPSPGFCVKSVSTDAGYYIYASSSPPASPGPSSSSSDNFLEPTSSAPRTLKIPKGVKVFLNIAWDKGLPAPPPADEVVVRRAMMGEDLDDAAGIGEGSYYVPVVVSEPREDKDKAGKPSIVFDCVFNASLKSRCTKDPDFKMYIIELALEHVEEKVHITLSRQIGTPNIASKGKLEPRMVLIPTALLDPSNAVKATPKPAVQEISAASSVTSVTAQTGADDSDKRPAQPKSVLKNGVKGKGNKPLIEEITATSDFPRFENQVDEKLLSSLPTPRWQWVKEDERIKLEFEVPRLTRDLHADSTLDIESRRILLHIPEQHFVDINLDSSDARIGKIKSMPLDSRVDASTDEVDVEELRVKGHNAGEALRLKRQRDFDVDNARAEWRIGEGKLIVWA